MNTQIAAVSVDLVAVDLQDFAPGGALDPAVLRPALPGAPVPCPPEEGHPAPAGSYHLSGERPGPLEDGCTGRGPI